jgi:hypothetical protein
MNNAKQSTRIYYREKSADPEFKKQRVVSLRVDDEEFRKLTNIRKLLANRIGARDTTMSTAIANCITMATIEAYSTDAQEVTTMKVKTLTGVFRGTRAGTFLTLSCRRPCRTPGSPSR